MSRLRYLAGAVLLSLFAIPASPAHATTLAPSCVDLNNSGVCDPSEPALAPLLNFGSFDTSVAVPGYVPPGGLVGVVLNNFPLTEDGLSINATGDIHVNGKMKNPLGGDVDLETGSNLVFGYGAQIQYGQTHDGAFGLTLFAANIDFGPKTRIKVGGDGNFWDIEAEHINVGLGAKFEAKGDDTEIDVIAINGVTFATGVGFKTSKTGTIHITTNANIAATSLKVQAGTIDIEALPPDGLPFSVQRTITLINSNINQTDPDGYLTISAGQPFDHSASDVLTLQHTRVKSADPPADLQPTPIIL